MGSNPWSSLGMSDESWERSVTSFLIEEEDVRQRDVCSYRKRDTMLSDRVVDKLLLSFSNLTEKDRVYWKKMAGTLPQ